MPDAFKDDVEFLKQYTPLITLARGDAKAVLAPALQGRILTSTTGHEESFGWINRDYFKKFKAGQRNPHFSPFGGEDRFWMGPEGGQFSLFHPPDEAFDLDHWFTPPAIDTEPYEVVSSDAASATFRHDAKVVNHSKNTFDVRIDREVRLLPLDAAWNHLGTASLPGVNLVAVESDNRITNAGQAPWTKETGLLSIWILTMLNAAPDMTVVVPIKPGGEDKLGPRINDDYFGHIPPDRLKTTDTHVFFKADAKRRSKIGTSPRRTSPVAGSYAPSSGVLTIVQFTFDPAAADYVNSAWKIQDNPFSGDVVNSYTDGPPEPGKPQMGNFYEIETSSPAAALAPGQSQRHVHRTMHVVGDARQLDVIAKKVLGVGLDQITGALAT